MNLSTTSVALVSTTLSTLDLLGSFVSVTPLTKSAGFLSFVALTISVAPFATVTAFSAAILRPPVGAAKAPAAAFVATPCATFPPI